MTQSVSGQTLLLGVGVTALCLALCSMASPAAAGDVEIVYSDFSVWTPDSVTLEMTWFADRQLDTTPIPIVVLLPMMNSDRSSWHGLDSLFAERGWKVLSLDQRGHGASTRRSNMNYVWRDFTNADFASMVSDVGYVLDQSYHRATDHTRDAVLDTILNGADFSQVVIVGASIGSSVALYYGAGHDQVRALVLLSPGMNYRGLATLPAMDRYRGRPVYLTASQSDVRSRVAVDSLYIAAYDTTASAVARVIHHGSEHGTDLFVAHPGYIEEIVDWIQAALDMQ